MQGGHQPEGVQSLAVTRGRLSAARLFCYLGAIIALAQSGSAEKMKSADAVTLNLLCDIGTTLEQLTASRENLSPELHRELVSLSNHFRQELDRIRFAITTPKERQAAGNRDDVPGFGEGA